MVLPRDFLSLCFCEAQLCWRDVTFYYKIINDVSNTTQTSNFQGIF